MQTRSRSLSCSDQQCSLIDLEEENKRQFFLQQKTLHYLFGSKITGKRSRSDTERNKILEKFKNAFFVKELIAIICDYLACIDKKPLIQRYKMPLCHFTIIGDIEGGKFYIEMHNNDRPAILTLDENKLTCSIEKHLPQPQSDRQHNHSYEMIRYHNQTYTYLPGIKVDAVDAVDHSFETVHAYSPLSLNEYSFKHYLDRYQYDYEYVEIFKNNIFIKKIVNNPSLLFMNCNRIGILKDGTEFLHTISSYASKLNFILFVENKINVDRPCMKTLSINLPEGIKNSRIRMVSILNSNYIFVHIKQSNNKTKSWFLNMVTKEWTFITHGLEIACNRLYYSHHHKKIILNAWTKVLCTINVPHSFLSD
jgi:hypothetical protein